MNIRSSRRERNVIRNADRSSRFPPAELLRRVVDHYIRHRRRDAAREQSEFRSEESLTSAIARAALSEDLRGKRHGHQRRIPRRALVAAAAALQQRAKVFTAKRSFEELHDVISETIRPIRGIGELAIYDIAQRIGAKLGLEAASIYLHAGTREGAAALGFERARSTLHLDELPAAFRRLAPREVEDVLCIYKRLFTPHATGSPAWRVVLEERLGSCVPRRSNDGCSPRAPAMRRGGKV